MRILKRALLGLALLLTLAVIVLAATSYSPDLPVAEVDARFVNEASRFVVLDSGARIHVRDEGKADGPALVLLHGTNDSLHTWEPWVAQLAGEFRLVSLDLPAQGLTGRVPDDDYSDAAYVRTVHGVVEKLGLRKFALAGNSMGGTVAWEYTLAHPDRIEQLVLVDAGGYPHDSPPPTYAKLLAIPGMSQAFRHLSPRPLVAMGFRQAVADPAVITDASIDRTIAFLRREGTRDAVRMRRQLGRERAPIDRLREIQAPTLILWGDRDQLIPVSDAQAFDRDIPNSRAIVYAGIGHMPMREIPQRSAADTAAFLHDASGATALVH
jgi:pimeloyl-ACP methyl ester carboxylesterase